MSERPTEAAEALAAQLERLRKLVVGLSDETYSLPAPKFGSGIGTHIRHMTDHVRALLAAATAGSTIYYDRRVRGTPLETDRGLCIQELKRLAAGVRQLASADPDFELRVEQVIKPDGTTALLRSTLARELVFVLHHAFHHDAQIAAQMRARHLLVDREFGLAPATLAALSQPAG